MPTQIELIKQYGLSIRGFSGQHLLIDPNVQRKIVDLLEIKPSDLVLEIGPGDGRLTEKILDANPEKLVASPQTQHSRATKLSAY